jgi:hypothetical protein
VTDHVGWSGFGLSANRAGYWSWYYTVPDAVKNWHLLSLLAAEESHVEL